MSRICILAKAPIPGMVKTRMSPPLTPHQAATLQHQLLVKTLRTALQSEAKQVELWTALDHQHGSFLRLKHQYPDLIIKRQVEGDLGNRMSACFSNENDEATVVIGTDCPSLQTTHINTALVAARTDDCHFIPALDGGYVLVASTGRPECFDDIQWGTDQVWSETQRALEAAGQYFSCQNALPDLDRIEDIGVHSRDSLRGLGLDI